MEARREHHQYNQELTKPTRHVGFSLKKPSTGALSKKESDANFPKHENKRQSIFHSLLKGSRRTNNGQEETEKNPETPEELSSDGETPSRWKRMCCC